MTSAASAIECVWGVVGLALINRRDSRRLFPRRHPTRRRPASSNALGDCSYSFRALSKRAVPGLRQRQSSAKSRTKIHSIDFDTVR